MNNKENNPMRIDLNFFILVDLMFVFLLQFGKTSDLLISSPGREYRANILLLYHFDTIIKKYIFAQEFLGLTVTGTLNSFTSKQRS